MAKLSKNESKIGKKSWFQLPKNEAIVRPEAEGPAEM